MLKKHSKEEPPDFLYHYTTIKSLPYIFKAGGKVSLRLTDYRFLNDAEEGIFLAKIIKNNREDFCKGLYDSKVVDMFNEYADDVEKWIDWLQEKKAEIYLMSFTELDDSMQFWRQDYAKEKGLCLKLKTANLKVPNKLEGSEYDYNNHSVFSKVRYFGKNDGINAAMPELKQNLEDFRQAILDGHASRDELLYLLPRNIGPFDVKNRVWKSEAEWRMKIIHFSDDDSTIGSLIADYKVDELGIPRATIEVDNPFEEIILGPSFTTSYVASIKKWLSGRGFDDINVRRGEGVLNY